MVILTNRSLPAPEIIRNLGMRFRDYRMQARLTRKDVATAADVGLTTIYKFESGNMTDISFSTLHRLLRAIGMGETWEELLPELPDSPYLYDDRGRRMQRVRHKKETDR